jgi:hypothetical protein
MLLTLDLMRADVVPPQPDDPFERLQELFLENDLMALSIVNNLEERRVIGMNRRFDIASAYLRRLHSKNREA